jgi:hypothetical protein
MEPPRPEIDVKLDSKTDYKCVLRLRLALKIAKSAKINKNFIWVPKTQSLMPTSNLVKKCKKSTQKNYRPKHLHTVRKVKICHFLLITLHEVFATFPEDSKSASNLRFLIPILHFCRKICTFCKL